jgi:hypothetical protein
MPTTVHMLDRLLSDPAVLGALLGAGTCNCLMMLYERMQTIRINALVIEQLSSAPEMNDRCLCGVASAPPRRDVPAIWVSYGSRARYYRRGK